MCGIAGVLDLAKTRPHDDLADIAKEMGDRIRHRGPDEGDEWIDAAAGIALAHRRLSIIDLSAKGAQPMISASGRYVITFNGEIYNFRSLRKQLEDKGVAFLGHSDTEVLLEAFSHWDFENVLSRLIGMFALALWDREERTLFLARDRLGIKPLYWGQQEPLLFFTSELKSLFAHPDFRPAVNRSAVRDLVEFNYIPGPQSIYDNISQLEPGCFVRVGSTGAVHKQRYWCVLDIARKKQGEQLSISDEDTTRQLEAHLLEAVQCRMIADVPLGAFLSGGVDSSTVVALMQIVSDKPVKTFTIGFRDGEFNEDEHARDVAHHLGTEHHEFVLDGQDALDVIPSLSNMYCEPFADSSQIPTYLVSAAARQHVTVALSGDGGDEVFGGYNRYSAGAHIWPRITGIPRPVRQLGAGALRQIPQAMYDRLAVMLPKSHRPSQLGDKISKLAGMLESSDLDDFYNRVVRFWGNSNPVVDGMNRHGSATRKADDYSTVSDSVARMQLRDMLTYLPGDILTKVDRASMATGLEARVPLLDHRVVEFAWSLPMSMKIRNGQTKWLLRRVLEKYVPRDLIERPKSGFAVPLGAWLRGPLRSWAEDLLSEESIRDAGLFHPDPIRKKWHRHLNGHHHEHYSLWSILMAQDWHRRWIKSTQFSRG